MSYSYELERSALFTDEGSAKFVKFRDEVLEKIRTTGAMRAGRAFEVRENWSDSWVTMAAIDRMVEIGDIQYIGETKTRVWQHQVLEVTTF